MKLRTLVVTAIAAAALSTACYAQDVSVNVNGTVIDFPNQKPVVVDGRTLIPLRGVFDNMGYEIGWNGETKTVTLSKASDTITINIGESCYYLNGTSYSIDVPAQIINGSTMLPLRAIGDASGCEVLWDAETKMATLINAETENVNPIEGTVYTNDQSEADFINELTNINTQFNSTAYEFIDYFGEINKSGINSMEELKAASVKVEQMKSAADTAISRLNALQAPGKYSALKTVSIEYMQSISDLAGAISDVANGKITADEFNNKLNTIGTQLALKEAEYQKMMASIVE